jgi:hypothetical protein
MNQLIVKAFVLCTEITDTPGSTGQKDLRGAGLSVIHAPNPFPIKHTFWVDLEISDQKPAGKIQLALMRADSGRRMFIRSMPVEYPNRLQCTIGAIRVYQCSFPAPGVYFLELWYDKKWQMDQRFEVV